MLRKTSILIKLTAYFKINSNDFYENKTTSEMNAVIDAAKATITKNEEAFKEYH
ncbi:hypothetical protein V7148_23285 [Gottfriedia acidiceleris]|uniref:hypothetical protein n=1 Tax=Bacillaceae TaxID=186817 RepID=UPI00159699AD|nr:MULTISPECIES: hypothetical protein [unclassified Bacillus (in: firmicutes)]